MRRLRLLWQIFFAYLGIALVLILLVGLYAGYEVRDFYLHQQAAALENGARLCEARIADLLRSQKWAEVEAACKELAARLSMRITVILPSGKVVGESSQDPETLESHRGRPEIVEAMDGSVGQSRRLSATRGEELMYVAVPVTQRGEVAAVIRTSFPIRTLAHTLDAVYLRILVGGLVAAAMVAAASLAIARRIARPLEAIRSGAERFARGELEHRLVVSGPEEVRRLAESMNDMARQLHERIQAVVRQENEHQAVLSSMEEGVLALDPSGAILSLNQACARMLNLELDRVRGRLVHEVVRKTDLLEFVDRTLSAAEPVEEDLQWSGVEIHARGAVLRDGRKQTIGALVVLYDATRLRHLERVRRDFVANVSHELRTPITSIKGFVETLLAESLENKETALRFLGIVLKQADRLDAIIQDLLTLAQVEKGAEAHAIELAPQPVADVLRAAVEMCQKKADDRRIAVQLLCSEDLAAAVNPPLLEQAVVNLLDNAIKYSEPGGSVRLAASQEGADVVIRVEDHGCGIEPKHLPRLFERFYRVDRARSRELGGTGLGLAIVKHIVAAHGGTVEVQSTVGQGSTFSIRLPAVSEAADAQSRPVAP
jgi:two-component system phosphate regulon sensor histidine kinase PhoR